MKKNPFEAMANFYNKCVKKQDKKGYADLLKECTEYTFNEINERVHDLSDFDKQYKKSGLTKLTFEDVQFLDGYYIFGTGTNSVIQFHIKEVPGWLFGIWWDVLEKDKKSKQIIVNGQFFAQYEETIDKFKPSKSNICYNINLVKELGKEEKLCGSACDITDTLIFMHNEPELAFCRDYCGWNYNIEYHTRAEAKKQYQKYRTWQDNKDKFEPELDERVLNVIKECLKDEFESGNAILFDKGDNWSPRYDLVINKDAYEEFKDEEDGCYSLSDAYNEDIVKTIEKEVKACEKISDKYEFIWFAPINYSIELVNKNRFKEIVKLNEETNND